MKLYELTTNYLNLVEVLESGEVEPEVIGQALEEVKDSIGDKLENMGKLLKTLEAEKTALHDEKMRLQQREFSISNNIKRLKEYMETCLKATGEKKIKGKLFTFSIQKNPTQVRVVDLKAIPEWVYKEVITETMEYDLDKKKLKEIMEADHITECEGIEFIQSESLRIR